MSIKIAFSLIGIFVLALLAFFLLGLSQELAKTGVFKPKTMTKTTFKTTDGVDIVADYYSPRAGGSKSTLLIHMMPADRSSWRDFAPKLQAQGYHVLALDLRGHGESVKQARDDGRKTLNYKNFSDADHQASIRDVDAAVAFLEEKGVKRDSLVLIGASIGANLSLQYVAENPEVRQAVLLSPGLDYRGIETEPLVKKLHAGQRLLFATSEDDASGDGSNAEMNRQLYNLVPGGVEKKILVYKTAGHGTEMLALSAVEGLNLTQEILNWLK